MIFSEIILSKDNTRWLQSVWAITEADC